MRVYLCIQQTILLNWNLPKIVAVDIYRSSLRPLLFRSQADPEWLHQQTIAALDKFAAQPQAWLTRQVQRSCCFEHPGLTQTLWGLNFANPIGLAAGFDKDGLAAGAWANLGFGFAELGTVTHLPQPGNPQPRLFRLPDDHAVLNRMGFNNQGAKALADRLALCRSSVTIPLGINLGKSKLTPIENAAADYRSSFCLLRELGDYFVVNVSSPNTPGLRSLQARSQLEPILAALQQENIDRKPLLVKIAPDLNWAEIAAIVELAQDYKLAGIIATNTTIARDGLKTAIIDRTGNAVTAEAGGISGAPLRARSTEVIRQIYQHTQGQLSIVGVGGIFTADDAWEKITAGASLVQVYTGWIYEGPWMLRRLGEGLVQKLQERGLSSIQAAIGSAATP